MYLQAYSAKQRAKEAEREAQEDAQRAEIERAEAERRAAEDAEADKWMGMISTEGEGTEEAALQEESQVRLRHKCWDPGCRLRGCGSDRVGVRVRTESKDACIPFALKRP